MTAAERLTALNADSNVHTATAFEGTLPPTFSPAGKLQLNCIIKNPKKFDESNIRYRVFRDKKIYFAVLDVVYEDGTTGCWDFYPTSEVNPGFVYSLGNDGKAQFEMTVNHSGDLYNLIHSFIGKEEDGKGSIQLAMDALAKNGRDIKVTLLTDYNTRKFDRNGNALDELTTRQVHTTEFV